MPIGSAESDTGAAILSRIVDASLESLSPDAARSILALDFPAQDHDRMQQLAAKARAGTLSEKESAEIEQYNVIGHLLALLQSKARRLLKRAGAQA